MIFGLTGRGIEPKSTALVANALFTRPMIGNNTNFNTRKNTLIFYALTTHFTQEPLINRRLKSKLSIANEYSKVYFSFCLLTQLIKKLIVIVPSQTGKSPDQDPSY